MDDFRGIGLDASELTFNGIIVGHRLLVTYLGNTNKVFARVDLHLDSRFNAFLSSAEENGLDVRKINKPREGKLDKRTDKLYFGNDTFFIELAQVEDLLPILKVAHISSERLSIISMDFKAIVRKDLLYNLYTKGIDLSDESEERFDEKDLCYSCRFLGSMDSWSGSEDICDATTVSKKVLNALDLCLEWFNSRYKINAYYTIGEKGWIYIYMI